MSHCSSTLASILRTSVVLLILPIGNCVRSLGLTETSVANPAGCYEDFPSGKHTLQDLQVLKGEFPRKDFEWLLSLNETGDRHGGQCKEGNYHLKWCPEPNSDSSELLQDTDLAELRKYISEALTGINTSLPLAVAVFEGHVDASIGGLMAANFFCGWERLQLLETRSAVVVTKEETAQQLRTHFPKLRVLYHPNFDKMVAAASDRTNLTYKNRLYKMVVAMTLLDLGFDLVLSDLDVYWVRDPVDVLHQLGQTGVEFAAQKDFCWLELNSGFLYYRATDRTKNMLRMALNTFRDPKLCADNDQYLINCGFARASVGGLSYRILPPDDFQFVAGPKLGGNRRCTETFAAPTVFEPAWVGDGRPYVWHTGGFGQLASLDQLASFGLIDIDASNKQCIAGARGTTTDAERVAGQAPLVCSSAEGAINHAACEGHCKTPADHAQQLIKAWALPEKASALFNVSLRGHVAHRT